ncbi:MAG: GAF domain-containing protein, partial [Chloroflexota bacterium]|nr:GAF domain-containing protein [Chloroflexota bacterium]
MRNPSQSARGLGSIAPTWLSAMAASCHALRINRRLTRATALRLVRQVHPAIWKVLMGVSTIVVASLSITLLLPDPGGPATIAVILVGIAFATAFAELWGGVAALLTAALFLNMIYNKQTSATASVESVPAVDMAITIVIGAALLALIQRNGRDLAHARAQTSAARAAASALASVEQLFATWTPGDREGTDRALLQILTTMVTLNRAHAGSLYLLDEHETMLRRVATYGAQEPSRIAPTVVPIGEGFAGRVAEERRPLSIDDIPHDRRFTREGFHQSGIRSIVGVPLIAAGDRLLGVATVALYAPHQFSKTEVARLEALAGRTVAFLESARGADRQRDLLEHIRGSHRRLQDVIMAMPEAVVVAAPDGTVLASNAAAERLFGGLTLGEPFLLITGAPVLLDRVAEESALEPPLARTLRKGAVVTGVEIQLAHR